LTLKNKDQKLSKARPKNSKRKAPGKESKRTPKTAQPPEMVLDLKTEITKTDYPRKIIFHHGRAIGDALMFTAGLRDFKLLFPQIGVNVDSNFPDLWAGNPYIDSKIKREDPGVEYYDVGYPIINNANNSYTHFTMGFLLNMIAVADLHKPLGMNIGEFCAAFSNGEIGDYDKGVAKDEEIPEHFRAVRSRYGKGTKDGGLDHLPEHLQLLFGAGNTFCKLFARQRGDIYLTQEEKEFSLIHDLYGESTKYWVVSPGGKSDCTCKIWDWRKFQEVINYFEGMLKFVIIGRSDHIVEKLNHVIDMTDKYNDNVRGMIPLVYHAEGCVSGVSFLMHMAAAVPPRFKDERKPCVAIYGGREPTSFTAYCNHQILHTNGAFTCCSNGGCWHSRVIPLPTNPKRNTRFCDYPVNVEGRTVPQCMNLITAEDVIRAIEKYYDGNIYSYMNPVTSSKKSRIKLVKTEIKAEVEPNFQGGREINFLASLSTKGGGEQSACKIVELLRKSGWNVHFYPWGKKHDRFEEIETSKFSFEHGMAENMTKGIPLFFYANDQIFKFLEQGEDIVSKSSMLIAGINYVNADLPKCRWLDKTGKLRAIIFQNTEKLNEFKRDQLGFENTELIALFGAIDLDKFLEVCPEKRENKKDPFIIVRHTLPDWRKFVTVASAKKGDKIHLWQKKFDKEPDIKFYARLLKDTQNTEFHFMEAHPELIDHFKGEPRMVFYKFDYMDPAEFLKQGHLYLHRCSNAWRDQYPRVVAEALASGLPVLSEPRDGTKDRIVHGETGFYCVHYDDYLLDINTLKRKTDLCYAMGAAAKEWARKNLDPQSWIKVFEELCLVEK